jgi:D-ribose pyranase
MKRRGILNAPLSAGIARLGHLQTVMVTDAGMPLPYAAGTPIVDLALVAGVPRFTQVLDALLDEIAVQAVTAATEAKGTVVEDWLARRDLVPTWVPHDALKAALPACSLVVRTGETTSFANVLLTCGVTF